MYNYHKKADDNKSVTLNSLAVNSLELLEMLGAKSVTAVFFDPQYQCVVDKLHDSKDGQNHGKERCKSSQTTEDAIAELIRAFDRILKPNGYLFLWLDKDHLCNGIHSWIDDTNLNVKDMIVWNNDTCDKGSLNRRTCKYLMVFQKLPTTAKDIWNGHSLPDIWNESVDNARQYLTPAALQEWLLGLVIKPGDTFINCIAGDLAVLEICEND